MLQLSVRPAAPNDPADRAAIWTALEPVLRAGETFALPRTWSRNMGLDYWFSPTHEVFVASEGNAPLGTYYLRPNQQGGGAHVANCAYITAPGAGGRGVARAMCAHSLAWAKGRGYRAMQFNFVVQSNIVAVHLWQAMGFEIVGRLPRVFAHPTQGDVDAFVMHRAV